TRSDRLETLPTSRRSQTPKGRGTSGATGPTRYRGGRFDRIHVVREATQPEPSSSPRAVEGMRPKHNPDPIPTSAIGAGPESAWGSPEEDGAMNRLGHFACAVVLATAVAGLHAQDVKSKTKVTVEDGKD